MIIEIRKGLQSKAIRTGIAFVIIATLIAAAGLALFEVGFSSKREWVMKINGQPISPGFYAHELQQQKQLLRNLQAQYGDLAEWLLQMSGLPNTPMALAEQSLVQSALLDQQAKKAGIYPSPAYVQQQIAHPEQGSRLLAQAVPAGLLTASGIDQRLLGSYLARIGLTERDVEQLLERAVGRQMLLGIVSSSSYIPHFYTDNELFLADADRAVSVALLAIEPSSEQLDQEQLQRFYDEQVQAKNYHNPEKRSGAIWRFDPGSYDISISQNKMRDYYQANRQRFIKEPAKLAIEYALFKPNDMHTQASLSAYVQELHDVAVENPEQFQQLVTAAQAEGVEVVFETPEPFERGTMLEAFGDEFDRRIFALPADNAITPVLDTPQGLAVVKRIGKQKRQYHSFEQVEDEVRAQLREERFLRRFTDDVQSLVSGDDMTAFQDFARKHKATEQSIDLHARGKHRYDEYLFAAKEGRMTPFIDGQVGVVVRVDEIEPTSVQKLETIREQVADDFRSQEAQNAASKAIAEIIAQISAGHETFEQAVAKHGLKLETVQLSSEKTEDAIKKLEPYGIDPQALLSLRYQGELISSNERPANQKYAYIAHLDELSTPKEREDGTKDELALKKAGIQQNVAQAIQNGYVASLRRNATIEMNSSMPIPQ